MSGILDWVVGLMRVIGAPGVGVATALETVFPPIPSELVLPLAGYTAHQGHYSLWSAILWATVGSVVGAAVLYQLGVVWGLERLRRIADRMPLTDASDIDRSSASFARHGRSAVFVGRLIPGIRSVISIPAGLERMPWPQFLLYTTAGSLLWNGVLIVLGYELGSQWQVVERYVGPAGNVVWVLVAIVVVVFVARRLRRRHREGDGGRSEGS